MARLTYAAIASLDGYIEDEEGKVDWAVQAMRRQVATRTGVNRC
jgi:hypothetical protein